MPIPISIRLRKTNINTNLKKVKPLSGGLINNYQTINEWPYDLLQVTVGKKNS
jgi:hypothetical protein